MFKLFKKKNKDKKKKRKKDNLNIEDIKTQPEKEDISEDINIVNKENFIDRHMDIIEEDFSGLFLEESILEEPIENENEDNNSKETNNVFEQNFVDETYYNGEETLGNKTDVPNYICDNENITSNDFRENTDFLDLEEENKNKEMFLNDNDKENNEKSDKESNEESLTENNKDKKKNVISLIKGKIKINNFKNNKTKIDFKNTKIDFKNFKGLIQKIKTDKNLQKLLILIFIVFIFISIILYNIYQNRNENQNTNIKPYEQLNNNNHNNGNNDNNGNNNNNIENSNNNIDNNIDNDSKKEEAANDFIFIKDFINTVENSIGLKINDVKTEEKKDLNNQILGINLVLESESNYSFKDIYEINRNIRFLQSKIVYELIKSRNMISKYKIDNVKFVLKNKDKVYSYESTISILSFINELHFEDRHSAQAWWDYTNVSVNGENYKTTLERKNLYVPTPEPYWLIDNTYYKDYYKKLEEEKKKESEKQENIVTTENKDNNGFKSYYNPESLISFDYPSNLTLTLNKDKNIFQIKSITYDITKSSYTDQILPLGINVTINNNDKEFTNFEEFKKEKIKVFEAENKDYLFVEEKKINDNQIYRLYKVKNGSKYYNLYLIIGFNSNLKNGYLFSFTQENEDTFYITKIIDSIKFGSTF